MHQVRILVGILYSDEPQFHACMESVAGQLNCFLDHLVIENLPKDEAHNMLYSTFMSRAGEFDLFVKLDADMVIQCPDFFEYLGQLFTESKVLDHYHLYVYDDILKTMISGLNVYRSSVKWGLNKENYFTDRQHISASIRRSIVERDPHKNWVIHCPNPSRNQIFNFGLHRGIKAFQYKSASRQRNTKHGFMLLDFLELKKGGNSDIIYAILGFVWAIKYKLGDSVINRQNEIRKHLELRLSEMDNIAIQSELSQDLYLMCYKIFRKFAYIFLFYTKL